MPNDKKKGKVPESFKRPPGRNWGSGDGLAGFGALISAMGGGGDSGNAFPQSDADELASGARFIPGEVTLARRAGKTVNFHQSCGNACCWYWEMPNGDKIYHFTREAFHQTALSNGVWDGEGDFSGDAGSCPSCGNSNTNGGTH